MLAAQVLGDSAGHAVDLALVPLDGVLVPLDLGLVRVDLLVVLLLELLELLAEVGLLLGLLLLPEGAPGFADSACKVQNQRGRV